MEVLRKHKMGTVGCMITSLLLMVLGMPGIAVAQTVVTIPAATPIVCKFTELISPQTAVVGQQVFLTVVTPIIVDGKTVVEAGAPVFGEVSETKDRGMVGAPAKIIVQIRTVEAVDGKRIPVSGQVRFEGDSKVATAVVVAIICCVLGLLIKGGKAEVPAESEVTVQTMAQFAVEV